MITNVSGPARCGKSELLCAAIAGYVAAGQKVAFLTCNRSQRRHLKYSHEQMLQFNPQLNDLLTIINPASETDLYKMMELEVNVIMVDNADKVNQQVMETITSFAEARNAYLYLSYRT